MKEELKRLFFGVEIHAPWPSTLPQGRMLDESHRHLTLAFLGNVPFAPLQAILEKLPLPTMRVGTSGFFESCLFLPPRHPHVVSWQPCWWNDNRPYMEYQATLSNWLADHSYSIDQRPWRPHVTLCRHPFKVHEWKEAFHPLPFHTGQIHLYESVGELKYLPIHSIPMAYPFKELEHTADMAFLVRGEDMRQLYHNAFAALAFKVPELMEFFLPEAPISSLMDIMNALNGVICRTDCSVGCPLKAVSLHGEIEVLSDHTIQWEMIVDV